MQTMETEDATERNAVDVSDEALAARCRDAGLKATAQRVAVLRSLMTTQAHPSPETTFVDVQRRLPTISRGTVYKTLEALEDAGLVHQVALRFETKRYDGNVAPHHHLVCTTCNGVTDINHPALDGLRPPEIAGFSPASMRVQVLGTCEKCAAAGGSDVDSHGMGGDERIVTTASRQQGKSS